MKNHALLAFVLAFSCWNCWADTHCKPDEVDYFSCKIKNKMASLCGSTLEKLGTSEGWLQYRFGKPGQLELVYPADKVHSYKNFEGESREGLGVRIGSVSFKNKGIVYTLESSYSSLTKIGFEGVRVSQGRPKNTANLSCNDPATFTTDFTQLADQLDPKPR